MLAVSLFIVVVVVVFKPQSSFLYPDLLFHDPLLWGQINTGSSSVIIY